MKIIGYIPARLGSERVKLKNLKSINGRPLVSYAIGQVKQVSNVDAFYLNTESEQIADVARELGLPVFLRDPFLARAETLTDDIVVDFVTRFPCDVVLIVNPTAPLLTSETIESFVETFKSTRPDSLFSTTTVRRHAVYDGIPINFDPQKKSPRTQDLKPVQFIDFIMCAFDVPAALANYKEHGSFLYRGKLGFFETPESESADVDTEVDFFVTETLLVRRSTVEASAAADKA
jgi:CMP-N-acetylneuraminic acid synthetase